MSVRPRSLVRAAVGLLAIVVASVFGLAGSASAHISLAGSEPANVTSVPGPISEVRLTFTGAADPVADGFDIVDRSGTTAAIASIENDGPEVLVVTTEQPLPTGRTRLAWAIRSGDSHTMTGSLVFTVTPSTTGSSAPVGDAMAASDPSLDDLPDGVDESRRGVADHVATASRWVVFGGLFVCVGGLAYLAWVHRGTGAEARRLVFYLRRAACVVVLASTVEWLAQVAVFGGEGAASLLSASAWSEVAGSGFAKGTVLRILGAALVLRFLRVDLDDEGGVDEWSLARRPDAVPEPHDRRPTGAVAVAELAGAPSSSRLRVEASPLAVVGAAALVLSESFIGHTATVDPRPLVLVSDAAHLVAGAAWSAGALLLALTLRRRHRRQEPLDARLLATRFSLMATAMVAIVAVSGAALAWSILREPSALWSTEFGRILLVKLGVVGVAVGIGAHNRRVLVPALQGGEEGAAERFRRTVTVEIGLFAVVLLLTALLVAASPT